jgi:predicted O-linked N-acetylglucosamine transferase (SPINDLY family)
VVTKEDRRELVYWHREWGRRVEEQAAKTPVKRPPPRRGLRPKIRVGLMSSDLRDHPVAYFALPIIEHYDRERFEFVCYSFYPAPPDRVQSFIQQRVLGFRSMLEATDQEIAQQIADDDLDILFELGGSTRYNRLEVMAYHAAPLQASWLGYPHSAGIGAIDYILVDPYLKPDDPSLLIEKPFVMPESWVVLGRLGFRDEPIEPEIPADRNGFLTFGTMNNPYKYTPELFGLWAEVMNRVPDSRFLFVRPEAGAPSFRANVAREFGKHGVAEDRLLFESVRGKHLRHYNRIDIALDSAPHTGGTTTCETLWMGCPTVSLAGEAFFERLSYSNLSNAGLSDLCGFTREQYVDIAAELAKDKPRLRDLRQNLRGRLRTSPLGDAERWVKNFEATIDRTLGRT